MTVLVIFGIIIFALVWLLRTLPEGPVQELKIMVDLPPEVDVKMAPLILNSVDASLLAYLLKRCTMTNDHGKVMLHYKRRGEIYNSEHCTFEVNGATYKPEKLKVLYCH